MKEIVIGVVADTHVPDRVENLHPRLCQVLREAGVDVILHAGDVCSRSVLDELAAIAPVTAVQGNRDLLLNGNTLPQTVQIDINGRQIGLMHGFGNLGLYFLEKFNYFLRGYQFSYFRKLAIKTFPQADVIIFGHTHRAENMYCGSQLIFNPGSAAVGAWGFRPSIGLLRISAVGGIQAEIKELDGAVRKNHRWVLVPRD